MDLNDTSPEVRAVLRELVEGNAGIVQRLLKRHPERLKDFLATYGTAGDTLDRRVYEAVYIRVSALNGCEH